MTCLLKALTDRDQFEIEKSKFEEDKKHYYLQTSIVKERALIIIKNLILQLIQTMFAMSAFNSNILAISFEFQPIRHFRTYGDP